MKVQNQEFSPEKVLRSILDWAANDSWHKRAFVRLKAQHLEYMLALLNGMKELNENEMNQAWARLPSSLKTMDSGQRIVAEFIVCFSSKVYAGSAKVS